MFLAIFHVIGSVSVFPYVPLQFWNYEWSHSLCGPLVMSGWARNRHTYPDVKPTLEASVKECIITHHNTIMLNTTLLCRLYEQSLFLLRECREKLNTRASTKIACRVEMCRARVTFPRGRRFLRSSGMTDCLKSIVARMCDRNLTLFITKHIKYGNFNKVELFWMKILNSVGRSHQLPRAERETRGRNGAGGTPGHMWGNWGLFGNSATNSNRCGGETWALD